MKRFIVSLLALGVAGVLSGCQTANTGFDTEKEVDPSEVRIILPAEAIERDNFKIIKAEVRETGSYRSEKLRFTGGQLVYDRYFRGGFRKRSKKTLLKYLKVGFPDATAISPVEWQDTPIGTTYYASFQYKLKKGAMTCLAMETDYGAIVPLRGGPGTAGFVYGYYCEPGKIDKFSDTILPWVRKVRIR